ncbi:MAG: glycosyltransferase [Microthrixaceae bacterium]
MPLISIVTPVYNTPEGVLRAMVKSVQMQEFTDWELCMVDDGSPDPEVRDILRKLAAEDPRIRVEFREQNGGIVAASNDALAMCRGEFVSFLDHDDELYPGALPYTVEAIRADAEVDYVYTDEDKINELGYRHSPHLKPDWSPERMRCQMYTCHFGTIRRSLIEQVGGFRQDFEGSQDFDLVLRISELARKIVHIPIVLYGWRIIEGSAAGDMNAKPYAWTAGQRAVQSHCDRTGVEATVIHDLDDPGHYRLKPQLTKHPKVSIVIPTNGDSAQIFGQVEPLIERCVRSVVEKSTYDNYELIVVADSVVGPQTKSRLVELAGERLTIVDFDKPFNFSQKINVGVAHSTGEYLLMLNDDTAVITPEWIESLLMYATLDGVGAVGPKLLFEDGRVQHAGLSTCIPGSGPVHLYRGFARSNIGYFSTLRIPSNVLAVTGACLMTPLEAFDRAGGLSELFASSYNDVDYCLKLRELGLRSVYAPESELYHFESMSRDPSVSPSELALFTQRWGSLIGADPYYNRNLMPDRGAMRVSGDYGFSLHQPIEAAG